MRILCEDEDALLIAQRLGDHPLAKKVLDQHAVHRHPNRAAYVGAAQERFAGDEGDVEVDDDATVSWGADPGSYVMAWVWVDRDDVLDELEEAG